MAINDPADVRRLLTTPARWAVVGLSQNHRRTAYGVAAHLQDLGMDIVPIHPKAQTVHGATGYRTLAEVPGRIDVVDLFVNSSHVAEVVDAAIEAGAGAIWMQLGVEDDDAAARADAAGLTVIMDMCPTVEARRLGLG